MRNLILFAATILLTYQASCQSTLEFYNFDFEQTDKELPDRWERMGTSGYRFSLDSTLKVSGKNSVKIERTENTGSWGGLGYGITEHFGGKKLKLKGYIKTEGIEEGFASLFIRIDPVNKFADMSKVNLRGTADWKEYEISIDYNPQQTEAIYVGGFMTGKGKMWLDNLVLTIDGKDIRNLKPVLRILPPAKLDKEFDAGSKVEIAELSKSQTADLKKLGLIWGFLKYYHPKIAGGNMDWDYELFRILPPYLAPGSDKDKLLTAWIARLGDFREGGKGKKEKKVKLEPDLEWIRSSGFSEELTGQLLKVRYAERNGEHYYVELQPDVGNPNFFNEKSYPDLKEIDSGYRLLSLFRYWNIIQYYYPYKNLLENDWKHELEEFIPKVVSAGSKEDYVLTILELTGRIHDSHAFGMDWNWYIYNYFGQRMLPVRIRFIEDKPVVTGFYTGEGDTGLEEGDVITHVNGKFCEEIIREQLKYIPGSNFAAQLRDLGSKLLRSNDSTIILNIEREGQTLQKELKTIPWEAVHPPTTGTSGFKILDNEIAYMDNGLLKAKELDSIWVSVQNTGALIIDCRNYPSDLLLYKLSEYLLPDAMEFVKFSEGSIGEPGLFRFRKPVSAGKRNRSYYKGKVLILVDETTQSSAEFHVMAYSRHPNTVIIGSPTAGADGNISKVELPGNITTWFSGIGVYYPDGRETQRTGILPDVIIKPTIKGVREGRDEVLEKAVQLAAGGKN